MRMWMIPPEELCRKHLLGEHREIHTLYGSLIRGKSIFGYLENGLLEPQNMNQRHDDLVIEMKRRGYNHQSPLNVLYFVPVGYVNRDKSVSDLMNRCNQCFKEELK